MSLIDHDGRQVELIDLSSPPSSPPTRKRRCVEVLDDDSTASSSSSPQSSPDPSNSTVLVRRTPVSIAPRRKSRNNQRPTGSVNSEAGTENPPFPPGQGTPQSNTPTWRDGTPLYGVIIINPIPASTVPPLNQFLIAAQMQSARRGTLPKPTPDLNLNQFWQPFYRPPPLRPTPIQTAGEGDYFNGSQEHTFEERAVRHMCSSFYARFHHYEPSDIARYLVASRFPKKSALTEHWHERISDLPSKYQTYIMDWYVVGLRATINQMGGLAQWQKSAPAQRMEVYEALWRQDYLGMAKASLGTTAIAVPLYDIFSDTSALHIKWQKFHKTVFCWTCEDVWRFRIAPEVDRRIECFDAWRSLPQDPRLDAMRLGDVDEIPISWAGVYDTGRRKKLKAVERDDRFVIPDVV